MLEVRKMEVFLFFFLLYRFSFIFSFGEVMEGISYFIIFFGIYIVGKLLGFEFYILF